MKSPLTAQADRKCQIDGFLDDMCAILDVGHQSVKEEKRVEGFQSARTPLVQDFLYRIRGTADELRRDHSSIDIRQMTGDLAGRHATGIHGQNLFVEALELSWSLVTMAGSNSPLRSRSNSISRSPWSERKAFFDDPFFR
jgi:hypothetical protein